MMADMTGTLKVFTCYLLPNCKLDGVVTWLKASGQHGDLELLKWFQSDIQDGHHGSHLESGPLGPLVWSYALTLNILTAKPEQTVQTGFHKPGWVPQHSP